jgi:Holliday junction resolvasome RuvABC ATP-dependent DNA helicase subunit
MFNEVVGQEKAKRIMSQYVKSYRVDRILPHFLFVASKGTGKTFLATSFAQKLKELNSKKNFIYLPCSSIKNYASFYERIVVGHIANNKETCILMDESSELKSKRDITVNLLTALAPNAENRNYFQFEGDRVEIDFGRTTFLFCTTDPQSMIDPLKDRLENISLTEYSSNHLIEILKSSLAKTKIGYEKNSLNMLGQYIRGNPRASMKMADKIRKYLSPLGRYIFKERDVKDFIYNFGFLPLGLDENELTILKAIEGPNPRKLIDISALTGMEKDAIQKDHERYLFKNDLIRRRVDGRVLTQKGRNLLQEAKKYE